MFEEILKDPSKVTVIGLLLAVIYSFASEKIMMMAAHLRRIEEMRQVIIQIEARHLVEMAKVVETCAEWKNLALQSITHSETSTDVAAITVARRIKDGT